MRAQRGHAYDRSETGSNPPARKAGHKSLFHGIHPTPPNSPDSSHSVGMRIRVFGVIKHTYLVSHDTHAGLRARETRQNRASP